MHKYIRRLTLTFVAAPATLAKSALGAEEWNGTELNRTGVVSPHPTRNPTSILNSSVLRNVAE